MTELTGRLLVADDVETNRDMLSRRLRRRGHVVELASDGREALERLRDTPYDLVLLDIMMPEMNGYQVLEAIRTDPALSHIPVIVISAVSEIDSVARCIEMGAEDYLLKPFNPVLLHARIHAVLEKKRLRDQERAFLAQIAAEKKRADDLLRVILPDVVIEELKQTNHFRPRRYNNVAILFCDIVGFTAYCNLREPEEVIAHLQELTEHFEELAQGFGLEKIKTIGDAFMAAGGLLHALDNPASACIRCGLEMIRLAPTLTAGWQVRAGVHLGPVMAGVVGHRQYLFDVWGDTVNIAARLEGVGAPGTLSASRTAWEAVAIPAEARGHVAIRGKGDVEVFQIVN